MFKLSTTLLGLVLLLGCASAPVPSPSAPGTAVIHRNAVLHEGPELVAAVTYQQGKQSVAGEWLVLAVELTSPRGSGPTILNRDNISLLTPEGRRLTLTSQDDFRRNFPRLQIPIERTLQFLPLLYLYQPSRIPNDRWFYADPQRNVAFDEIPINASQTFSGPLIFNVPGGVQPGRWRLVFELEESRPNIPFIIELGK